MPGRSRKSQPKLPVPSEAETSRNCAAVLESRGIRTWRRNVAGVQVLRSETGRKRVMRVGERGQSDRWGILPDGRHIEIEIKRPGKRPGPAQVRWLMEVNGIGRAVAIWVDNPATLERILDAILAGARVVYSTATREYAMGKGRREVAPCGDFDLVFPPRRQGAN